MILHRPCTLSSRSRYVNLNANKIRPAFVQSLTICSDLVNTVGQYESWVCEFCIILCDLSSVRSDDNNLRATWQEIHQPLITRITLKITYVKYKISFKSHRGHWVKLWQPWRSNGWLRKKKRTHFVFFNLNLPPAHMPGTNCISSIAALMPGPVSPSNTTRNPSW